MTQEKFAMRLRMNQFSLLSQMDKSLKKSGVPTEKRKQILAEAQSGDDQKLLETILKYFNIYFD